MMYVQVDSALEEVEQMDLTKYLALVEQYKPRLGPSHYQLVIMRRYCTHCTCTLYTLYTVHCTSGTSTPSLAPSPVWSLTTSPWSSWRTRPGSTGRSSGETSLSLVGCGSCDWILSPDWSLCDRYLTKLDPGYSQYLGLSTIELRSPLCNFVTFS